MKLPTSIRVGHSTWTIKVVEDLNATADDDGNLVTSKRWLQVNKGLHPEREREVIVHECLHALIDALGGLKATGLDDDDDEERLVALLTGPLFAMLRDNPDLVAYLTAE